MALQVAATGFMMQKKPRPTMRYTPTCGRPYRRILCIRFRRLVGLDLYGYVGHHRRQANGLLEV